MMPVPPAQVQEAPTPREVAFDGFNRFPLKGTVQPAEGGSWFAVLVGDSGPLDRDWSQPRLPAHTGRALAHWLRDQGVGSLRFDKRIAGSRDPKLNASLDAQSGDILAALAAARALPEARNRRILLVGHGEGALLSLLAAREADALLLLAMPSQPMGKALAEQVALQLHASQAAPNRAYLDAVLQAIRSGRPAPAPGPDVLPPLVRLAKGLMAPETLDFVRDTLDLDPWAMVARVAVPVAVAWGGKDIQTWKPAQIPAAFRGTVLDLPDANHVFRREPGARSELDGARALEGYRDERPLADLSPISAWIRTLK
ncbi:hypothetical protein [Mesoterricola silvestris]|uniref:Acyl-CoA thioester hydrolase n=1 Tax=Mesoterricola silvestris TaxID=2927979 RepID=A0AA48GXY5_9BACT|nr:hypothetical protein [Mesoterricola silvestris]BDU73921.1 acyl-CoA thioester hydrolase [Mesoterricola silvestris]